MTDLTRRALAAAPIALAAGCAATSPPTPPVNTPGWMDATETAAKIRSGEMSALEAVRPPSSGRRCCSRP